MNITFWKDNKLDGEHQVNVEKIIKEFLETDDSKLDMPFQRLLLIFMADKYGSYDIITDAEWIYLHEEWMNKR